MMMRYALVTGVRVLPTVPMHCSQNLHRAQPVALFLTALILENSGFITRAMNQGQIYLGQPQSALFGIRLIVGLIPGLCMLIGLVILFFFPIQGQRLREMKETILVMHAEKEAQLSKIEE